MTFKGGRLLGAILTNFITFQNAGCVAEVTFDGMDLSVLTGASNLIQNTGLIGWGSKIYIRNCRLNQNINLLSAPMTAPNQPDLFIENSDYTSNPMRNE
jgi:hypothetical protein